MDEKMLNLAIRAQFWHIRFSAGFGNRSYWGTFEHIFSDTDYTGLESEIANFEGRKTGLIITYWLANLFPDGVKYAEMEKRPVLRIENSPQNQEKTYSCICTASPSETIFP